jgi:hypothetical protein
LETKKKILTLHLSATILGGLWGFAASVPTWAAGFACRQDCSNGPCTQTACERIEAGQTGGWCRCTSASEAWDDTTFSAWCVAWEQPQPACSPQDGEAVQDEEGRSLPQAPVDLPNAEVLAETLSLRNPYVATLVSALQDGSNWVEGSVQGLIHDSYYDPSLFTLTHTAALAFVGNVTMGGIDAAQIDITVSGDIKQLARLKTYADSAAPSAMPPRSIQGTVTDGGLHGSLQVIAFDGRSETIQW